VHCSICRLSSGVDCCTVRAAASELSDGYLSGECEEASELLNLRGEVGKRRDSDARVQCSAGRKRLSKFESSSVKSQGRSQPCCSLARPPLAKMSPQPRFTASPIAKVVTFGSIVRRWVKVDRKRAVRTRTRRVHKCRRSPFGSFRACEQWSSWTKLRR
jgi:hypothetical protein